MLNILKNAAEAGATRAALSARCVGEEINLVVDDDRTGLPADAAPDVFLPFFTSKATGTGIGLSLARQVAVAHGGMITAGAGSLGGAVPHQPAATHSCGGLDPERCEIER